MNNFIGEIRLFAGNFPPLGWAFCDGSLLSIAQNTALFALIGTTYGGDGQTTFALPDLRGRVPLHQGTQPGTSNSYVMGQQAGVETVTLTSNQIPSHNHSASASTALPPATGTGINLTGPATYVPAAPSSPSSMHQPVPPRWPCRLRRSSRQEATSLTTIWLLPGAQLHHRH